MKSEHGSEKMITCIPQQKLKKMVEKVEREITEISRNNLLDSPYFSKSEDLVIIKWGLNVTVINTENSKVYKVFDETSSGRIIAKVLFYKNSRYYGSLENDLQKLISGSNWWMVGRFEIISGEDLGDLLSRLKKGGIELDDFLERKPSLSHLKSLVRFLNQADPEQNPSFIAMEFRDFSA